MVCGVPSFQPAASPHALKGGDPKIQSENCVACVGTFRSFQEVASNSPHTRVPISVDCADELYDRGQRNELVVEPERPKTPPPLEVVKPGFLSRLLVLQSGQLCPQNLRVASHPG